MTYIVDRVILFFISCLVLGQRVDSKYLAVFMLVTLLVAAIDCLYEDKRINIMVCFTYIIACAASPELFYLVPLISYGVFYRENKYSYVLVAACECLGAYSLGVKEAILMLGLIGLSYVLASKSNKVEILEEKVKQIRDDSIEMNLSLSSKNRQLIEKQDQEVYVATLKERNRIAREIHDNVGHMLTRSILQMGALMTIHKNDPVHNELEAVKGNLDIAMNNIRESVHDLHDESIDLEQAIREIAKELEVEFESRFIYDVSNNPQREYKYAIIGVVKEAASNAIKYSLNNCIDITLREHPAMYQLIIHDYLSEGAKKKEKDVTSSKSGGIGISNMEDRAARFGGQLRIINENGYKVIATFMK